MSFAYRQHIAAQEGTIPSSLSQSNASLINAKQRGKEMGNTTITNRMRYDNHYFNI